MKKNLFLSVLILPVLLLAGCTVNSNSGEIIFYNNSDADVTLKIGDISLWAAKGGSNCYYYYMEFSNQPVSIDGLTIERVDYNNNEVDSVNLRFNYRLVFRLDLVHTDYFLYPDAVYAGDQNDADPADCLNY